MVNEHEKKDISLKIIPSACTIGNLLFGIISLLLTCSGKYTAGAIMILCAMCMDGLDGKVARRLNATSEFGKELDSICDVVSFGAAPALLVYAAVLEKYSFLGAAAALLFTACGALRLARFNISGAREYFIGVPITAAGGFAAFLVFFRSFIPMWIYFIIMLILSLLMIGRFRIPKL